MSSPAGAAQREEVFPFEAFKVVHDLMGKAHKNCIIGQKFCLHHITGTAGQLLLTRRGKTRMYTVGIVFEFYTVPL